MTAESIRQFHDLVKIELERSELMDGMSHLMGATKHLQNVPLEGREQTLATELLSSIGLSMEDRNKDLAEKGAELWHAILAIDGAELSSREIDNEMHRIRLGEEWIERIKRRILEEHPHGQGAESALLELRNLDTQLSRSWGDLSRAQDRHQWTMAELLSRGPMGLTN